jgi:hypothetical protein
MIDLATKLEIGLKPEVNDLRDDFRASARSIYKKRSGKLARGFSPSIKVDADGWGLIRFKSMRQSYILNRGHERKKYLGDSRRPNGYMRTLPGSGFLDLAHERHIGKIADKANEICADVSVRNVLK